MRYPVLFLIAISVGAFTGCGGLRNYMLNRAGDAADIVRADVSVGAGSDMGFHGQATRLLRLEAYSTDGIVRTGYSRRALGVWGEDRDSWGFSLLGGGGQRMNWGHFTGQAEVATSDPRAVFMETADEFGLGFHLFVAGARAGIRPWQIVDFAFGLIGLDFAGDDLSWDQRQDIKEHRR